MDYYDPRRRALRAVRQLLYPRECPFCGRVLGDVRDCPDCAVQLETLRRKPGIRLDPAQHYISNLAGAAAPYRYSGCVRRGILNAKYQGKPWRAVEMGNRLVQLAFGGELTVQYGELLPQPVPWAAIGYDLIVPVPASGKRRGYNVPELMALPLAKAMEVPLAPQALERTRAKRHQAGLPLEQRIANVAGAFRAAQPQQLEASASCWWMTSSPPAQQLPPARRHCFTPGQTAYSRWPLPRWSLAHRRTTPPPSMRTMRKMCIAIFENNALSRILLAGKSRDSKM